jgi:NTE family protein
MSSSTPTQPNHRKHHEAQDRPPFEQIALLLQGGGALGAYQGGVYEALAEAGVHPDWVAGISVGAINSALIVGNTPQTRVDKLRSFWEGVTSHPWSVFENASGSYFGRGDLARSLANQASAGLTLAAGAWGFFTPRVPPPWLAPSGAAEATSWYDTAPLRAKLEQLIDFDRINAGDTRLSIGAVNVRTGNFTYFDTTTHTIGPAHIMSSGALPPGFPAVEIDGEHYWDGGMVSNTPLQWVLESEPQRDTLAFQVDLWSARGDLPRTIAEVTTRQKEIQYSSRTRANSDRFRQVQKLRGALAHLLAELPADLQNSTDVELLRGAASSKVYNLIQLIYHSKQYEGASKDYDFSRLSMQDHWRAGYHDTVRTLRHPEVTRRPEVPGGVFTFDLGRDGRE